MLLVHLITSANETTTRKHDRNGGNNDERGLRGHDIYSLTFVTLINAARRMWRGMFLRDSRGVIRLATVDAIDSASVVVKR